MELEAFELVILRRPDNAPAYDEETLERIQSEHVAYLDSLRAAGHIVTSGPVLDQPDAALRGLTFYATGSLVETRRLAEQDPAVVSGRLTVDVMTWLCGPGTMARPGRPVSIPEP
jgi:uncharacterized protein YciI